MWPILAFGCPAVEVESGFGRLGLGGRLLEWRFQIGGLSAEIKLVCREAWCSWSLAWRSCWVAAFWVDSFDSHSLATSLRACFTFEARSALCYSDSDFNLT